jgi:hypothetical protein
MKEIIARIEKKILKSEERIERTVAVNFDGRQFSVRIPKRISDLFEIRKGNKIKFIVSLEYVEETGKKTMVVELLD